MASSLANEIELIPGPFFIEHHVWQQLVVCCLAGNSQAAFKACFEQWHAMLLASLEKPKLTQFERLIKLLVDTKNEAAAYKNNPNSLSRSTFHKEVNFAKIAIFIQYLQEEKVAEAVEWLKETRQELQQGVFGVILVNKLAEFQPFNCSNLTELQEYLELSIVAKAVHFERHGARI